MAVKTGRGRPYAATNEFVRAACTMAATRPAFYARAGHAMDPDAVADDAGRVVLQASQALAKELGRGPDSAVIVAQRVRRWMGEGKVPADLLALAEALLLEDALPAEDAVLAEIVPLLRKRIQRAAVDAAISDLNVGDLGEAEKLIIAARKVGLVDEVSTGTSFGQEAVASIMAIKNLERLPTGVTELDHLLDRGLWRGALGMAIGGPGDGKSMWLTQVACEAMRNGRKVAFATLELPEAIQHVRIMSNLSGVPIDAVLDRELGRAYTLADASLARANKGTGRTGGLKIREFSAYATDVGDIIAWVDGLEQSMGEPIEVVVVDYGDKVGQRGKGKKGTSEYDAGREVFEGFRINAQSRGRWWWTASQSRRKQDKKQKLTDMDDVADSMHKVRVADLVLTLNVAESINGGDREVMYFVAKNRVGDSRKSVGPYPVDYAIGRLGG